MSEANAPWLRLLAGLFSTLLSLAGLMALGGQAVHGYDEVSASAVAVRSTAGVSYGYDATQMPRTSAYPSQGSDGARAEVLSRMDDARSLAVAPGRASTTLVALTSTPRGVGAADDIVRYDPQWASRQLAGQNLPGSTGWATTPGGRTLSAHAAERTFVGGPGRAPINPGMIDDILAQGTRVSYRGANDTIRIGAPNLCGNCYVVVDAQNVNHIVTVMVPK